ncbi:hypothetical protein JHK85_007612 [Glycine max]|nr:hypothetical protein JHK85_007612 [Glycine max]
MELGALDLLDNGGRSISLTETYEKVASGKSGCCWELFDVYRHLKSIGYIIGRHGVAWSLKSIKVNDLRPDFDVYLPNSRFRKSCPGDPKEFMLADMLLHCVACVWLRLGSCKVYHASSVRVQHPPSRAEIEALEKQCGGIPLKICRVREGRVNFFSSDKVELPVLP